MGYSCKNRPVDHSESFSAYEVIQTDIRLVVHYRNADGIEISLCPLTGARANSPVRIIEASGSEGTDTIIISHNYLPGEFVLNFDRTSSADSVPVHFSQYLIVSSQDIELWINPLYGDYPDSTWFQPEEKENNTYRRFAYEAANRRKLLPKPHDSNLSSVVSDSGSSRKWIREYEKRRISYNNWIKNQIRTNRALFLSQVMEFEKYPGIEEVTRKKQVYGMSYLDEIDFSNPMIVRTSGIKRWMDGYVKGYEKKFIESEKLDSLLVVAGKAAIERGKAENSLIYGWMADYFYELYERNNNLGGIIELQSYLEDDECLTSMKRIVQQRSDRFKNIVPQSIAPDFHFINENGSHFMLSEYQTSSRFKLLLFWNTGCMNCVALTRHLYAWYQDQILEERLAVFAVNLDEMYDVVDWRKKIIEMPEWEHMIDKGGLDSEVANAYGILYTPIIILIDSKTGKIVQLPQTVDEIKSEIEQLNY